MCISRLREAKKPTDMTWDTERVKLLSCAQKTVSLSPSGRSSSLY